MQKKNAFEWCSTRPVKPRLRINSEDFMVGEDIGSANQKTASTTDVIILEQSDPNDDELYDEASTTKLLEEIASFASPEDISTV